MSIIAQIKEIQAFYDAKKAELFENFKELTLDEKIDIYCKAYTEDANCILDTFLKKEGYYHSCEGVSLYDDLYWDRHETMTLSQIFEWVTDDFDEDSADIVEFVKTGKVKALLVFRDMLNCNIGSAERDW